MTRFNLEKPYSNRPYNKPLIIEHIFGKTSAGNTKNVNNSRKITKEAEMKTNIDRSTVIKATQKIVNNAVNNVSQKNSADVFPFSFYYHFLRITQDSTRPKSFQSKLLVV